MERVIDDQASAEIGMDCKIFQSAGCDGGDCVSCTTSFGTRLVSFFRRMFVLVQDLLLEAIFYEVINPFRILLAALVIVLLGSSFGLNPGVVFANVLFLISPLILATIILALAAIVKAVLGEEDDSNNYQLEDDSIEAQEQLARFQLEEDLQRIKGGGMAG